MSMHTVTPEIFWSRIDKKSGCWEYPNRYKSGYGRVQIAKKLFRAHRYAYIISKGEIPEGMLVLHIRNLLAQGRTQNELAKMFNVWPGTISNIYRNKTWKHLNKVSK